MTVPAVPPAGALDAAAARRTAAPSADAATRGAQAFERMLLEQLTTQLAATAAPDEDEASPATAAYRDLLPAAMATALADAGGIGIAAAVDRGPA
jgi:Rod binding domain-containing protein